MRTHGKYRPSATSVYKKKTAARQGQAFFFFKAFFILLLVSVLGCGLWIGATKTYALLQQTEISDWHAKTVEVSGVTGLLQKEILAQVQPFKGKPFSLQNGVNLRADLIKKYPMLKEVRVKRGLFSGTLKVSAKEREPVAQFRLPDNSVKYVDADSVVYSDDNPSLKNSVPSVELLGDVPERLKPDFIELVQSTLKLEKQLSFAKLQMNLEDNSVTMVLNDKSTLYFGTAQHLKQKVRRAAQIMAFARSRYKGPVAVNFRFFEDGKVFLTHNPH
jgi:cell division septal protein FtsQ